jgi:hypothetical protein
VTGREGLVLPPQQPPGPTAIQAGVDALLAGLEARRGGRWVLLEPPLILRRETAPQRAADPAQSPNTEALQRDSYHSEQEGGSSG